VYAVNQAGHVRLALNNERHPVTTPEGLTIPPLRHGKKALVRTERFVVHGDSATHFFSQQIRLDKRFVRALHKIGFELLCLRVGQTRLLDPRFDAMRSYVRDGRGSRTIGLTPNLWRGVTREFSWKPHYSTERVRGTLDYVAVLSLGVPFFVDLSPDNSLLAGYNVVRLSDRTSLDINVKAEFTGKLVDQDTPANEPDP
jgi:hypothetical protein